MGFFKDLNSISKQAKEMEKHSDPGARLREMNQKMGALNAQMAQSNAALTAAPGDAMAGTVQIVSVAPTTQSINGAPVLTVSLLLQAVGRPPIPVTTNLTVPALYLARLSAGATLPARFTAADPTAFAIDWNAPA